MQEEGWHSVAPSKFPQNLKPQTDLKGDNKSSCSTASSILSKMAEPDQGSTEMVNRRVAKDNPR